MSTRCKVLLKDGDNEQWFYRHCDGYPSMIEPILRMATKHLPFPSDYHTWDEVLDGFMDGINLIARGCYDFSYGREEKERERLTYKQRVKDPNHQANGSPYCPYNPDRHWFRPCTPPVDYAHEYLVVHQGGSWILYVNGQIARSDVWCQFHEDD